MKTYMCTGPGLVEMLGINLSKSSFKVSVQRVNLSIEQDVRLEKLVDWMEFCGLAPTLTIQQVSMVG